MAIELPLHRMDLLIGLPEEEKKYFQRFFVRDKQNTLTFTPHASIIQKNEEQNTHLYIVISGNTVISVARRRLFLEKGSCFGEINFLAKGERTATVNAGPNGAIVLVIPRRQFDLYMLNRPNAAQKIIQNIAGLIAERLAQADQFLSDERQRLSQISSMEEANLKGKELVGKLTQSLLKETIVLLNGLTLEEVEQLDRIVPKKTFKPNENVFTKGEKTKELLHIIDGTAQVENIARLNVGQCIGEIGFVTELPRTADVSAGNKGLEVRVITPAKFQEFAEYMPATAGKIRFNLAEILAKRFRATLEIVEEYQATIHEQEEQEDEPRSLSGRFLRLITRPINLNR